MTEVKTSYTNPAIITSIRYPTYLEAEAAEVQALFLDKHKISVSKNSILIKAIELGLPIIRESFQQ